MEGRQGGRVKAEAEEGRGIAVWWAGQKGEKR
jgi:hypothetical protein